MTKLPHRDDIHELLEDLFRAATGERRDVTDIELEITPEQWSNSGVNWSCGATCKRQYARYWPDVYQDVQQKHPMICFG